MISCRARQSSRIRLTQTRARSGCDRHRLQVERDAVGGWLAAGRRERGVDSRPVRCPATQRVQSERPAKGMLGRAHEQRRTRPAGQVAGDRVESGGKTGVLAVRASQVVDDCAGLFGQRPDHDTARVDRAARRVETCVHDHAHAVGGSNFELGQSGSLFIAAITRPRATLLHDDVSAPRRGQMGRCDFPHGVVPAPGSCNRELRVAAWVMTIAECARPASCPRGSPGVRCEPTLGGAAACHRRPRRTAVSRPRASPG